MTAKPILITAFSKSDDYKNNAYNPESANVLAYKQLGNLYGKFIIVGRETAEFAEFKNSLFEEGFTCEIATEDIKDRFAIHEVDEVLQYLKMNHQKSEIHILVPRKSKEIEENLLDDFDKKMLKEKYNDLHIRAFRFNPKKEPSQRWFHEEYPLKEVLSEKTFNQLNKLTRQDTRVLLIGEEGTDKEEIARGLHQKLRGHLSHFLFIEGADFDAEEIKEWISKHQNGTVYLENIDDLQEDEEEKQFSAFKSLMAENLKYAFIVSVTEVALIKLIDDNSGGSNKVLFNLKQELEKLFLTKIFIPNLEDRNGAQIEKLLDYFITRLGIHIKKKDRIRLDDNVLIGLKKYPFPGNIWEMEAMIAGLYQKKITKPKLEDLNELLVLKDIKSLDDFVNAKAKEGVLVKYAWSRLGKSLNSTLKFSREKLGDLLGWGRKKTSQVINENNLD